LKSSFFTKTEGLREERREKVRVNAVLPDTPVKVV
jgi:hypothetical protein